MREPVTGRALVEWIDRQAIPVGAVGVWWLGQSSLVLKAAGTIVYVDPYLDPAARRLTPPACAPEDVTNADLVLLTHDHADHIDPGALPGIALASPGARFVAPRPVAGRVAELVGDDSRVAPATAGEALALGAIEVIPVAAKHEEFDLHPTLGYPYLGYVIRAGGVTIYNAGDTIPYGADEGTIGRVEVGDAGWDTRPSPLIARPEGASWSNRSHWRAQSYFSESPGYLTVTHVPAGHRALLQDPGLASAVRPAP